VTTVRSALCILRLVQLEIEGRRHLTIRTYEITFAGQAVPAVVDAFDEFEVTVEKTTTTLRGELADQAALHGAIDRVRSLGLELLQVRAVELPTV
jgi:hypothetical protein